MGRPYTPVPVWFHCVFFREVSFSFCFDSKGIRRIFPRRRRRQKRRKTLLGRQWWDPSAFRSLKRFHHFRCTNRTVRGVRLPLVQQNVHDNSRRRVVTKLDSKRAQPTSFENSASYIVVCFQSSETFETNNMRIDAYFATIGVELSSHDDSCGEGGVIRESRM